MTVTVVLASSSRYRAELLRRICPVFEQVPADVDETCQDGESVEAQVERLSKEKAIAVARKKPESVIIASDQLAELEDGKRLGKPGDAMGAIAQLQMLSGRSLRFLTGVCVIDPHTGTAGYRRVDTAVRMRELNQAEIERYVALEQPYDCAGSFKAESLGIALLQCLQSDDPTALIGLPLIATLDLLRASGHDPLTG